MAAPKDDQIGRSPALREQVYERLESMILDGRLQPGDRLVEVDLAERLGVSRGPVREATQLLAKDGWLDLRARQGTFVHVSTTKEIDDFFDLRKALEVESARVASLNISADSSARLRGLVKAAQGVLEKGGDPLYSNTVPSIHDAIADAGTNEALTRMMRLITKRTKWYSGPLLENRESSWREHHDIVEAICCHDASVAMELMGEHVERSRRSYKSKQASHANSDQAIQSI